MAITYTWVTKHLNTDYRGYGDKIYAELQGDDGSKTKKTGATSVLGTDLLKPASSWTQDEIDTFCESLRPMLEQQLQTMFEATQ
jgi:hypothetical protein